MSNTTWNGEVKMKRGDTAPPFLGTLTDAVGDPVNLSGASARLLVRETRTRAVKVDAACLIPSPLEGSIRYDWTAADTDRAGVYDLEVQVTYGDGSVETFPNGGWVRLQILADIA